MLWYFYIGILTILWGHAEGQINTCANTGEYIDITSNAYNRASGDDLVDMLLSDVPLDTSFCRSTASFNNQTIPDAKHRAADCPAELQDKVIEGLLDVEDKVCLNGDVEPRAKTYAEYFRSYRGEDLVSTCLYRQYFYEMTTCRAIATASNSFWSHALSLPYEEGIQLVAEIYMAAGRCVYRESLNDHCPNTVQDAQGFLYFLYIWEVPPGTGLTLDEVDLVMQIDLDPREANRIYLGVFGDPHVFSYKAVKATANRREQIATCLAIGTNVLYLDSTLVKITGTNSGVNNDTASVLTEVSISFIDKEGNTLAIYNSGSAFSGGPATTFAYSDSSASDVRIEDSGADGVVLIYGAAGFAAVLTKVSNSFALGIRVSESVAALGTGVLREGCYGDIVNRTQVLEADNSRRRKRGVDVCAEVDEEYREICEFDYQVTGDETLAVSGGAAIQGAEQTLLVYDEELTGSTSEGSGGTHPTANLLGVTIGILFHLGGM